MHVNISMTALQYFIDTDLHDQTLLDMFAPGKYARHDFIRQRCSGLLPPPWIEGKSVLDLGSCNGIMGAWALNNGASSYTGVEIQPGLHEVARIGFEQNFQGYNWRLENCSIRDFFIQDDQQYDIIAFFGTIHITDDWQEILRTCASRSSTVIVESTHPHIYAEMLTETYSQDVFSGQDHDWIHTMLESRVFKSQFRDLLEYKLPFLHYRHSNSIFTQDGDQRGFVKVLGNYPSLGLLRNVFSCLGFTYNDSLYHNLKTALPETYNFPGKFVGAFELTQRVTPLTINDHFSH